MSYLLRVYRGDTLFERELELHRSYYIGSKKNSDFLLPELGMDFSIEADEKIWHGNSKDKRLQSAFMNGSGQPLQKIAVLDAEKQIAVTVYQSGPEHSHSIDISNEDTISIGRSSSCDIVVADHQVSGRHLEIYRQGNKWGFRDNGSSNGTYLNESKSTGGMLNDEDNGVNIMIKIKNLTIVAILLITLVSCSNSSDATHTDADLSESTGVSNQIDDEDSSQQMDIENSPVKVSGAFIDKNIIATDLEHIFAIQGNGKVVATGSNREGELDTSTWENIVSVYADTSTSFGIAKDGTVCSSGMELGESDLAVIEGATSLDVKGYLIAVKEDGTIALPNYVMDKSLGWIDEALKWDGILKATSYGYEESAHIVGLKNDGTVVAAGNNEYGQCNVSDWENIIAIDVGRDFTVGLRDDGTVAIAGKLTALELEDRHSIETVDAASLGWTDIVAICAGSSDNLIGLKSDGTVVAVGFELSDWKDIVAIDATNYVAVGLKSNGTVIVETDDETMQWWEETEWEYCTDTWNDIRLPE